jgi:dimethylamine corrinoid protein
MMRNDTKIFSELAGAVVYMDRDKTVKLVKKALKEGIGAEAITEKGLAKGMDIVGEKYEKGEYYVPEMLIASDTMKAGFEALGPVFKENGLAKGNHNLKAVIGVIEGDFHEMGKDLVCIMLEAAGFQVTDLGRDVPIAKFVETAVEQDAGLICLSSLMSTSMLGMKDVIVLLQKRGLKQRFKVMVGGACVTADYARQIGADGYAPNAAAAVREAKIIMAAHSK